MTFSACQRLGLAKEGGSANHIEKEKGEEREYIEPTVIDAN